MLSLAQILRKIKTALGKNQDRPLRPVAAPVKNTPWRGKAARPQDSTRSILWTVGSHTRVLLYPEPVEGQVAL
ncbi:MAG: hypothetical protein BroJett011_62410 [Chloroflexota bacterium]|nr:MAG: hypothetical protein BroJett011_62410 [Chloroflexota bacterium]